MAFRFSPDEEFQLLKELLADIEREHDHLRDQHPIDFAAHERHRARLRALIQAIHEWRKKHV